MQKGHLPRIQQNDGAADAAQNRSPGQSATVLVAFAWIGATPIASIAGKETKEPPPAMAFMTPAIKEAATSQVEWAYAVTSENILFPL
jgi:hypothetical protein